MAWVGILASLLFNYDQHKHGRPTACSVLRWLLPRWAFLIGWTVFEVWFVRHIWKGYPADAGWWGRGRL